MIIYRKFRIFRTIIFVLNNFRTLYCIIVNIAHVCMYFHMFNFRISQAVQKYFTTKFWYKDFACLFSLDFPL